MSRLMPPDFERKVLEFYQLQDPYPAEWPAGKDQSDDSEEEKDAAKAKKAARKSRYQVLEKAINKRQSYLPGTEISGGSSSYLTQAYESDPLGTSDSAVRFPENLGVPGQDDLRQRNRFTPSSTSSFPQPTLSQANVGQQASTDQKSASLKALVESNFERFVRAKATIDNVYKEMKYRGAEPPVNGKSRAHSRHTSRSHFSPGGVPAGSTPPLSSSSPDRRKKNALLKESEYGIMGIKEPLIDVIAKAEDLWGPALGGREKESALKTVGTMLEKYKDHLEISALIADGIRRRDYETVVEEYTKARRFVDEVKRMVDGLVNMPPNDTQKQQIVLTARMWFDVKEQIAVFKHDLWKRLSSSHAMSQSDTATGHAHEGHMELISLLLELGVEDNPIWVYLVSRYDHLKTKIQVISERSKVEIELLRRRLAHRDKPSAAESAAHFQRLCRQMGDTRESPPPDDADVIELWDRMLFFVTTLLSPQGILGELVDLWRLMSEFTTDGKSPINLPVGYNRESVVHHKIAPQAANSLHKGVVELADHLHNAILLFFVGPPPEDLSLLFAQSPQSPGLAVPGSLAANDRRIVLDPSSVPPPSPRRGESWEKFAFWVPWSSSVSAVHYLAKILTLVGSAAADLCSIPPVAAEEGEKLRNLVATARDRCVASICTSWNRDAENMKYVEDWSRSPDNRDQTMMPFIFMTFESSMIAGMQKIVYLSDAMSRPGAENVLLPPPPKQLQSVRAQYVNTIYKALSGMVENAERSVQKTGDDWTVEQLSVSNGIEMSADTTLSNRVDSSDRNVRMLLTLSNLQALKNEVATALNGQFENTFSVKLTDESKTIRDVVHQIDARLFQSYTKHYIEHLRSTIRTGITSETWAPPPGHKPQQVRAYVTEVLLSMVLVHSQVSTTAGSLTMQVLSYLLEQTCRELLESFRQRQHYDLASLMQATLDVEFLAQAMSLYTTDKAADIQSAIYQELDARTDNDARAGLQIELPEMRVVLKRLRDSTRNEFSCFRKQKRPGVDRQETGSSARDG